MSPDSATTRWRRAPLPSDPMSDTLRCTVVTPVDGVFDGEATYVNLPAWDGQLGVMPGTSPFLTRLGIGVLTIHQPSGRREFAIDGGFAQMQDGVLTLLADDAFDAESIDRAKSEAELTEVSVKLAQGASSAAERRALERAQRVAFTKVGLARR